MASWGYGVALAGKTPVLALFENFTGILFHQVKPVFQSHVPLVIVATHAGIGLGHDGKTHQSLVDMNCFHEYGIPTFEPSDPEEAQILLREVLTARPLTMPAFVRLVRQPLAVLDKTRGRHYVPTDGLGIIYEPEVVNPVRRVTIFAAGATVPEAIKASEGLRHLRIKARVVAVNQLHVVDPTGFTDTELRWDRQRRAAERLVAAIDGNDVYTIHDAAETLLRHPVGSALAMTGASYGNRPIVLRASLGIKAVGESGTQEELYRAHGIDEDGLLQAILSTEGGCARAGSGHLPRRRRRLS